MKMFAKGLLVLLGLPTAAIALFFLWASSGHHDKQSYAAVVDDGAQFQREPKDSYTIVTYNLGYLSGLANNTTNKPEQSFFEENQQRVVDALSAVSPDIVALQEVDFDAQRSYGVNQADAIAQKLGRMGVAIAINWDKNYVPFPYWPISAHFGEMLSGQAILSRYPIVENSRTVLQKVAGNNFVYNAFYLDRLLQVAKVEVGDRTIVVMSTHLEAFDEDTRVAQTQFVRAAAEEYAREYPVLLVGDFNSALNRPNFVAATGKTYEEKQFSIKELLASDTLASAVPQEQWPNDDGVQNATFPSDTPKYKLDYIFYTPSTIEILETQVMGAVGEASDHLPGMARFRLK